MTEPQPQQEYIITEDMLRWWRNQCIAEPAHTDTDQCKKCKYRGKGSRTGCCDFGDDDMEKIFRSRTHTPAAPTMEYTIEQIAEIDNRIRKERKAEREKVLERLKKDLETRFVPSMNQWSKGRNSGLLECCNIIDESLRGGA